MKFFIRFFLLLYLFVLSGYCYSHTYTSQASGVLMIKSAQSGTEKKAEKLKATEVEDDDELTSIKKRLEVSDGPPIAAFILTHKLSQRYYHSSISFHKYFFYPPTDKYIIYRVIRI